MPTTDASTIASSLAGASVVGAGIGAAASLINNTVNNLFQQPLRRQQISSMQLQDRLSQLNSQQQYVLALKLQQAQTDNERMQLLTDSVSQIDVATVTGNASILSAAVNSQSSGAMSTAIIIGASVLALVVAMYVLNKKN
jgi:TolA-binding protein